jgi:hypothetical protein
VRCAGGAPEASICASAASRRSRKSATIGSVAGARLRVA